MTTTCICTQEIAVLFKNIVLISRDFAIFVYFWATPDYITYPLNTQLYRQLARI